MQREFDAAFAGRKVKCKCGNIGVVPERPRAANSTGNPELASPPQAKGAFPPPVEQETQTTPPPAPRSSAENTSPNSLEYLAAARTAHSSRERSSAKSPTMPMKKRQKSSWRFKAAAAILVVGVIAILGYGFIGGHVSLNTLTPTSPSSVSKNVKEASPAAVDTRVSDRTQVTHAEKSVSTSAISKEAPQQEQVGLGRAGYITTRCLICAAHRSAPAQRTYSDRKGFGLCDSCGEIYHAWLRALPRLQANYPTPDDQQLSARFSTLLKNSLQLYDYDVQRVLCMLFVSGQFASHEWNVLVGGGVNTKNNDEAKASPHANASNTSDTLVEAWVKAKGGDVNNIHAKINKDGEVLMHLAAREGRIDVLTWLKKRGVDVNAKNHSDWTPMHAAAEGGHVTAMKWLKEQGANTNAKDEAGWIPMHMAAANGHVEAMKWLKEQGADVNAKNDKGGTPLHFAAMEGQIEAMKWLKEQGADVNAKAKNGRTPLSVADTAEARTWLRANGAK